MQLNHSYLKSLILQQIIKVFSCEALTMGAVPSEIDFAVLMQKSVILRGKGFEQSRIVLSLTTMLALDFFSKEGRLKREKAYLAEVIFSAEAFKALKNKTYGNCSQLQALALEAFISQLSEQFLEAFECHFKERHHNQKPYELGLQLSHLQNEIREYLLDVIDFDNSVSFGLALSLKSILLLKENIKQLETHSSTTLTLPPLTLMNVPNLEFKIDFKVMADKQEGQDLLIEKYTHYRSLNPSKIKSETEAITQVEQNQSFFEKAVIAELDNYASRLPSFSALDLKFKKQLSHQSINNISRTLAPLSKQHNDSQNSVEQFVLRQAYKKNICDKFDFFYAMNHRLVRLKNISNDTSLLADTPLSKPTLKSTLFLDNIRKVLPKLIMLNIECIKSNRLGALDAPLLVDWLQIAKSAGTLIVLYNDGPKVNTQMVRDYLSQHNIITDHFLNCGHLNLSEHMAVISSLVDNFSFDLERSQRLFIDKKMLKGVMPQPVKEYMSRYFLYELIDIDHDDILSLLAYRYDFQRNYETYFNGNDIPVPLTMPYGFNVRGFKNTLLVCSVSIKSFKKNIERFFVEKIKGGIEQPLFKSTMFFADLDKMSFTHQLNQRYLIKTLSAYAFSKTMGKSFAKATLMLLSIFKKEVSSLNLQEINALLQAIFESYLKAIICTQDELNKWAVIEFSKQYLIFKQNKGQRVSLLDSKISDSVSIAIYNFIFSAINQHPVIKSIDGSLAFENEKYLADYFRSKNLEFNSVVETLLSAKKLSRTELKSKRAALEQEKKLVHLYLVKKISHDREQIIKYYYLLFFLEKLIFYGTDGNGENFSIRRFSSYFLEQGEAFFKLDDAILNDLGIEPFSMNDSTNYYDLLIEIIDIHLSASLTLIGDNFCSLIKMRQIDTKVINTRLKAISQLKNNISHYSRNFAKVKMDTAVTFLDELIVILSNAILPNNYLIVECLNLWNVKWDINFKFNAMSSIHCQLDAMLTRFEQQFLSLSDFSSVWALKSDFFLIHSIMIDFTKLFGAHFFELRQLKIIYSFVNSVPSKREEQGLAFSFIRSEQDERVLRVGYFKSLSLYNYFEEPIDTKTSALKSLSKPISAFNLLCQKEILPSYLPVFKIDVIESLSLDSIGNHSLEELMTAVYNMICQRLESSDVFVNCSQISFLLDNLVKMNGVYKGLYDNYVLDPGLLNKISQQVSHLFIQSLSHFLLYQSSSAKWDFSWWESRSYIDDCIGDKRVSYSLPSVVKKQYCSIVSYLKNPKVSMAKSYTHFRHEIIEDSYDIKDSLPQKRKNVYASFFKNLPSSQILFDTAPKLA